MAMESIQTCTLTCFIEIHGTFIINNDVCHGVIEHALTDIRARLVKFGMAKAQRTYHIRINQNRKVILRIK